MSLSAELKAALAVIPEASRTIKLRGHDCEHWPIEAKDFAAVALSDKQLAMALFGVDMDTGQAAPPEQIAEARQAIPVPSAAKLIALSTRDPDMEALVPNMTKLERERSLNTALEVTTGGDPQGFFEEVARIIKSAAALISSLPKGPGSTYFMNLHSLD